MRILRSSVTLLFACIVIALQVHGQGRVPPRDPPRVPRDGEFVVGMFGYKAMSGEEGGCWTTTSQPTDAFGNPSSTLNVLREDGFNVFQTYEPNEWSSIASIKALLTLANANRMQVELGGGSFYRPYVGQDGEYMNDGENIYDNCGFLYSECDFPLSQNRWSLNFDQLYSDLCQEKLTPFIWGVHVAEEASYCHAKQFRQDCMGAEGWATVDNSATCGFVDHDFVGAEIPPSKLLEAFDFFRGHFGRCEFVDPKLVIMDANHGAVVNACTPNDPAHGVYPPQACVNILDRWHADEVYFEGSYCTFPHAEWQDQKIMYAQCPMGLFASGHEKHYLGSLFSIDYAREHASEVHKVIEIQPTAQGTGQDQPYNYHSDVSVPNANWLWFQAYASIIHGVRGVWFWDLNYARQRHESDPWADANDSARFRREAFPSMYREYVGPLARQLRYLSQNDFLGKDSQLFSSKSGNRMSLFANEVVIPSGVPLSYGTSSQDVSDHYDQYEIRYSLQANGSNEYVIIAVNPLPVAVRARLDFSCLKLAGIEAIEKVNLLFCRSNSQNSVLSSDYKTDREVPSIDLLNNTLGSSLDRTLSNGGCDVYFGPLDVAVIKFTIPEQTGHHNNGWQQLWTNAGSGYIDGWKVDDHDRFFWGDFDGDGNDEAFVVGYTNRPNDWMALLKFDGERWRWLWSNYGNSNAMLYPYHANFVVGDFNGDGKDELLGNDTWTTLFSWNGSDWDWVWSDYGNGSHMIRPYKSKFVVGDFDGDGSDELMGCALPDGWTTMFKWGGSDWSWWWSDHYNGSQYIRPYRPYMHVGDFTGDGRDDILGYDTWATLFSFNSSTASWDWLWSTNGSNDFDGWNYPLHPLYDCALEGHYDTDGKEEVLFISRGPNAEWAMSKDFGWDPQPRWHFNWTANPQYAVPYIDDWALNDGTGDNMGRYYTMGARAMDDRDYLVAMRKSTCSSYGERPYLVNLYRSLDGANKSLVQGTAARGSEMASSALHILDLEESMLHYMVDPVTDLPEETGTIEIQDVSGRTLWSEEVAPLGNVIHAANVSILNNGLYILRCRTSKRDLTAKFIVGR